MGGLHDANLRCFNRGAGYDPIEQQGDEKRTEESEACRPDEREGKGECVPGPTAVEGSSLNNFWFIFLLNKNETKASRG